MKHKCSKCGHVDTIKDAGRAKGGKARWKGRTKKERSEAASKAAKARWSGSSPACISNVVITDSYRKGDATQPQDEQR